MGLGDFETALKMRDLLQKLVGAEVESQRPRLQYATVVGIDRVKRKCQVQFPGETSSVWISMGSVQPQATGQVVRIDGIQGDRFVADVMGPVYQESPTINKPVLMDAKSSASGVDKVAHTTDSPNGVTADLAVWNNNGTAKGRLTPAGRYIAADDFQANNRKIYFGNQIANADLIRHDEAANRFHFVSDAATSDDPGNSDLQINELYTPTGGSFSAIQNAKVMLQGGGNFKTTSLGFGWSQRFIAIGMGLGSQFTTSGYVDITMPPDGTVITGINGAANVTVANGMVPISGWQTLWYEPVFNTVSSPTDNTKFYISNYATTSFSIPPHWIPVVTCSADSMAARFKTGSGREVDYWRTPTLTNSWANYAAGGYPDAGYRKENGIVRLKGLLKSGTVGAGGAFVLPVGFRPIDNHIFLGHAASGISDIRIFGSTGVVAVYAEIAGGNNADASLSGIAFLAEQ